MRNAQIQVYKYNELNEKAKDKVLNSFRENDYPFLEEGLKEELIRLLDDNNVYGQKDLKLYYQLDYSQGGGLCFIGDFEWKTYKVYIKHTDNHYYHSNSVSIDLIDEQGDYVDIENQDFQCFKTIYKDICKILERQGYKEIEYENSEECIKEIIELNEYEFNEDGSFFRGLKE